MTIYTDQVTGKKYDRVPVEDALSCRDCAFHNDIEQCVRAIEHCFIHPPGKTVFFVFKERKA